MADNVNIPNCTEGDILLTALNNIPLQHQVIIGVCHARIRMVRMAVTSREALS
jgi:hypothetical protein